MQEVKLQPVSEFEIEVEQVKDFEFVVRFDKPQFQSLAMDEPEPLGRDSAPSASRVLAAAIGNCLSASLLFCARKARVPLGPVRARVKTSVGRNEQGRLRISRVEVRIDPGVAEEDKDKARRCLDLFEDFCTVTQSVRAGIEVEVVVAGFEKA